MDNLTPITRAEKLWNGEDLEPLTREEMYIKRIFDKTQAIPNKPLTRKEMLMEKAGEGGGDVSIKQLSVTANGTYSEKGTAYSPVNVAVPLAEKSVTENGVYNASADSVAGYLKVNVNVPLPENAYLLKEASGSLASFSDGADLPMPSFVCNIDAVQDLHGYDGPWVGGAGKNKLPMTVDGIKTANTTGTWNENVYTVYGMTFTVNTDDGGNVTDIEANGTPSSFAQLTLTNNTVFLSGSFIGNGCPSGGGGNTYRIRFAGGLGAYNDFGSQTDVMTADPNTAIIVYIRVDAGATVDHLKFYPMLRLATETDPTFAPYSNICPISGHTGVDAWVRGKNLANPATVTTLYPTGDSGTYPNQIRNSSNARSVIAEVTPNTTYTISKKAGQRFRLAFTEEEPANGVADMGYEWNDTGTTITVTSPSNAKYMVVLFWSANVDTDTEEDMLATVQIEIGETATTYEPYNPQSQNIQVSWQTEAGEVFGGYVDLVSGELTVTHKKLILTTSMSYNYSNATGRVFLTVNDAVADSGDLTFRGYCNVFKSGLGSENNAISYVNQTTPGFAFKGDNINSVNDFIALLNNISIEVVYELATPITYQLTPTQIKSLLGENNAWCDTGDVDIDYFAKEVTE